MENATIKGYQFLKNLIQKNTLFIIAFFWISFYGYAQTSPASRQVAKPRGSTACAYGYYEYLPSNYNQSEKHPVVVFFHGAGESGNGTSELPKILREGPGMMVQRGKDFPFILISPQHNDGWWSNTSIQSLIAFIKRTYKVDPERVYVTGLSAGAYAAWNAGQSLSSELAAIVPVSGCGNSNLAANLKNLSIWAFHNSADPVVEPSCSSDMVNAIRAIGGKPKITIYPSTEHDAWTTTYNNDNMWSWLLLQRRFNSNGAVINKSPIVTAGSDLSVTLPVSSLTIKGSASDSDGSISKLNWSKLSGPVITMTSPSSASLIVSDLVEGVYTFRLTATDNLGTSSSDDVVLRVNGAGTTATARTNARLAEPASMELGKILAFPNPITTTNSTTLEFENPFQGNLTITLLDQIGNIHFTTSTTIKQSALNYTVDFSQAEMPSGIYFLRVKSESKKEKVLKIIKK